MLFLTVAPVRDMLHECDGNHLQFVLWQALLRFACSVAPLELTDRAPVEEADRVGHNKMIGD